MVDAVEFVTADSVGEVVSGGSSAGDAGLDRTLRALLTGVPPARGHGIPGGGQAVTLGGHHSPYQGTTAQLAGLYPFVGGGGSDVRGVPIGHSLISHEPVGFDPAVWLADGLVSNTGIWVQAQPGVGKSAFCKRLLLGLAALGWIVFIPADVKGEYGRIVREALGGVVFEIRRGRDRINPLDPGPLAAVRRSMSPGGERDALDDTIRARQVGVLEALLLIGMRRQATATQQLVLTHAVRIATDASPARTATIPDVHAVLRHGPQELLDAAWVDSLAEFKWLCREMVSALDNLCSGALKGLFDGESSRALPADVRAVSLDISALDDEADETVAAAMLCSWAWGGGLIEQQRLIRERWAADPEGCHQIWREDPRENPRPRNILWNQDEMWRALRAGSGLVSKTDSMTRLSRHKGVAAIYSTHSMDDLNALPTEEDRAKARGIANRCQTHVYGGLAPSEVEAVPTTLTSAERTLLMKWQSSGTWHRGQRHPGRGRYLIKAGERLGLPVQMQLTAAETDLFNTDSAWTQPSDTPEPDSETARVCCGDNPVINPAGEE